MSGIPKFLILFTRPQASPLKLLLVLISYIAVLRVIDGTDGNAYQIWSKQCTAKRVDVSHPLAKCIDGSNPIYYFREGTGDGITKFHIHFEGGGWCYDTKSCWLRSKSRLGSTINDSECAPDAYFKHYLSSDEKLNPLMSSWNHVYVRYCDGGSYAGDMQREHGNGKKKKVLYFSGRSNRVATIQSLLSTQQMDKASVVVISGCSAGALGLFLGLDDMAAMIKQVNKGTIVRGLADSGFFLDYTHGGLDWMSEYKYQEALTPDNRLDYSFGMKNVFNLMNISAGSHQECIRRNAGFLASRCIFPQYFLDLIETPLFLLQPQYDRWQIWHVLGRPNNLAYVNDFGKNTSSLVLKTVLGIIHRDHSKLNGASKLIGTSRNGVFLDSCLHHCTFCRLPNRDMCDLWGERNIALADSAVPNPAKAFADWFKNSIGNKKIGYIYFQDASYPCKDCCPKCA